MKSEGKSQNVVQLPSEPQEMSAVRMSFPRATSCKLSCVCLGLVCCCFVFRDTFIEVTHRATGHWGSQTTNHHVWAWNHAAWWHRAPQESRAVSQKEREIFVPTVHQPPPLLSDSFTISNTRKDKLWDKMLSPAHLWGTATRGFQVLLQACALPWSKGGNSENKSAIKKERTLGALDSFTFRDLGWEAHEAHQCWLRVWSAAALACTGKESSDQYNGGSTFVRLPPE